MKIVLIGSTGLREKFEFQKAMLQSMGHEVAMPAFDSHPVFNELELCEYNRLLIEEADEVHVIWDGRSVGTIFDFGMAFALKKPLQIIYIESKTIAGVMRLYAKQFHKQKQAEQRLKRIFRQSKTFLPYVEDGKIHFTRGALIFVIGATAFLWWLVYQFGIFIGSLCRG